MFFIKKFKKNSRLYARHQQAREEIQNRVRCYDFEKLRVHVLASLQQSSEEESCQRLFKNFRAWFVSVQQQTYAFAGNDVLTLPQFGTVWFQWALLESLIWEAAFLGHRALMCPCFGFDFYELQYLVEVARDLRVELFLWGACENDFKTLLETDAPYLGVWGYNEDMKTLDQPLLTSLVTLLPSTALRFALVPAEGWALDGIYDVGYQCLWSL